ncbi:MAG: hypothetical protein EOP11_11745 [Proteobacteria bacterium]|nr:MAG: hypothetical protein EOP11_11745 [Pseudomonadota bacterium]
MRFFTAAAVIAVSLLSTIPSYASDACRSAPEQALRALRNQKTDPEYRSSLGACLLRSYLDLPEVAEAALRIMKDPQEDLFLRQDLIEAFADARLRRQVKVNQSLAPEVKKEDRENLARTAASAGQLLSLAEAVKSMDDTVAVCGNENQIVRTIADLASAEETPVVLRATAVASLEKVLAKIVGSGIYDERTVRFAQENLRNVASRDDTGSYYSGAGAAYARLANANVPYFSAGEGRSLASIPANESPAR